jgi:hypothetical protein
MATWTISARGNATPHEAWARYYDTRHWPQWSPQIHSVHTDDGPFIRAGLTGKVRSILGPAVRFRIDAVDEPAGTWSWTVRFGPLTMRLVHGVEPDAAGCSTWLRTTGPSPVLVGYLPLARLALGKLVKA